MHKTNLAVGNTYFQRCHLSEDTYTTSRLAFSTNAGMKKEKINEYMYKQFRLVVQRENGQRGKEKKDNVRHVAYLN